MKESNEHLMPYKKTSDARSFSEIRPSFGLEMGLKIKSFAEAGNHRSLRALYYKNIRALRRDNYKIYKNRLKIYGKDYLWLNPKFETLAQTRLEVLRKMDYLAAYEDGIKNGLDTSSAHGYAWKKQNGPTDGNIQTFFRNSVGYHPDNVVDIIAYRNKKASRG